jgi:hypothetical protein
MVQETGVLPDVVLSVGHQELLLRVQETEVLPDVVLSVGLPVAPAEGLEDRSLT